MLRACICRAISSLFVDVGDNVNVLAELQLRFDWDKLGPNAVIGKVKCKAF